jgi:hypothetical protein
MYGDNHGNAWGGETTDQLFGGWGNDTLAGEGGNDYLYGEGDTDYLYGNDGHDTMYGDNHGNAWGGEATDFLFGGWGNDIMAGEGGDDHLHGEGDNDDLYGNDGSDVLWGDNWGNAWGGEGIDHLYGSWGDDTLVGEGSDDWLFGEGDTDVLYGGWGNDWLEAGSAAESADGEDGIDWNAHVWSVDGTLMHDIDQQQSATCVFLSTLAGAAYWHGYTLSNNISYEGNFTYAVRLFDAVSSEWVTQSVRFDGSMITNSAGQVVDPGSAAEGEFWTIVYQRAYLRHIGIDPYNGDLYDEVGEDDPFTGEPNATRAIRTITGLVATNSTTFDAATMQQQLAEGRILTAGGTGHRYTVLDVFVDDGGAWMVRLRNPWATDGVHSPRGGGTIDFNAEGVDDGIITVTWDTFSNSDNFRNYDFSG